MSATLTRPNRNIALIVALVLSPLIFDESAYSQALLVAIPVVGGMVVGLGWRFYVARYMEKKKRWEAAIDHYRAFEARARKLRIGRMHLPVFMSIYTYNGVALALNNMALCHMNLGDLKEAKRLCHEALEVDPKYAVPHINLGVIAALEKDPNAAGDWLQRGFDLGYRDRGVQREVSRILAGVNTTIGRVLSARGDDEPNN